MNNKCFTYKELKKEFKTSEQIEIILKLMELLNEKYDLGKTHDFKKEIYMENSAWLADLAYEYRVIDTEAHKYLSSSSTEDSRMARQKIDSLKEEICTYN